MIPCLYDEKEMTFSTNGIGKLSDAMSCIVTEKRNGSYELKMAAVQSGRVNCIIIKDFSRLGRNYIETGRYLEEIFPMYGVRVISILDRYDNAGDVGDTDGIIVPFKNLINDSYCRDISMKIRSSLEVKQKTGQFIGGFASYGYLKDPNDHNHLIIDPYAAEIVKMNFRHREELDELLTLAEDNPEIFETDRAVENTATENTSVDDGNAENDTSVENEGVNEEMAKMVETVETEETDEAEAVG